MERLAQTGCRQVADPGEPVGDGTVIGKCARQYLRRCRQDRPQRSEVMQQQHRHRLCPRTREGTDQLLQLG